MLKQVEISVLGALIALASLFTACSKQDEPSALPILHNVSQNANEDLVTAMSADQLVKDFVLADVEYAKHYATWYQNLSAVEKEARDNAVQQALSAGNTPSDPSHTEQETADYREAQRVRSEAVNAKHPQLSTLSEEEFGRVQYRLFQAFTAGMSMQVKSSGCIAGYQACNAACSGCNSCIAGYYACIQASPDS